MKMYRGIPENRTVSFSGDVIPDESRRRDLGSESKPWRTLYARSVVADSVITTGVGDADTVDGFHASASPTANYLLTLDGSSQFPTSVYPSAVLIDGTRALTANWDAGSFKITAQQFESDIVTGTAPFVVASTTVVSNLNADKLDSYDASDFPRKSESATINGAWTFNANITMGASYTVDGVDISEAMASQFVVMTATGSLANERVLTAGDGLDRTDGGAGGNVTLAVDVTDFIDTSFGLTESSNNIRINLAATSGLNFSSGALLVGAGDGIDVLTSTIAVDVTDILGNGLGETSNNIFVYSLRESDDGGPALSADASGDMTAYGGITFNSAETISTASGNLTISPAGDVIFDPVGNDILPQTAYDLNIGSLSTKYLTVHAAELWVETLVAQDTIATIGGRILVGPTTQFAATLLLSSAPTDMILNGGFETAGGGGADVFASWTELAGVGTITRDGTTYHGGSYSCKLTSGSSGDTYLYQNIVVTSSSMARFEFWTRGDGTNAGRYQIYDVTHLNDIVSITSTGITGTTWTKVTVYFSIPSGCSSVRYYFHRPAATGGAYAYFDDVTSIEGVVATVKHNQMSAGDIAYSESNGKVEFFEIISSSSPNGSYYDYWLLRNLDGTGANTWYEGDALFNTGASGDGFIDLYSYDGVTSGTLGPAIVGNVRDTTQYNDWTEHWAIGNLNGIYGYGADTYGVGLGKYGGDHIVIDPSNGIRFRDSSNNVQAQLSTGSWTLGITTDDHITIDTSNGVRFIDGSSNVQAQLSSGVWTLGKVGASLSNVQITSGAVNLRTNTVTHIALQSDGDVFIGENVSAAATTNFAIFTNAQTYNSESVSAGDVLIGDNSSGKANIFWDKSAGEFIFRNGTTAAMKLSSDGVRFAMPSTYQANDSIKFRSLTDSYISGDVYSITAGTTGYSGMQIKSASTYDNPGGRAFVLLTATGPDGSVGIEVDTTHSATWSKVVTISGSDYLAVSGSSDLRVGGGIYVGSTSTNPAIGVVQATVAVSGYLPFAAFVNMPGSLTASPSYPFTATVGRNCTIRTWNQAFSVSTTNDGSNYWTIAMRRWNDGTTIASFTTASYSPGTVYLYTASALDYSLTAATHKGVYVYCTKTGSPGTLQLGGPAVFAT